METILITVAVSLAVAFILGVLLGLFKKIFAVQVDQKVQDCRDALPGANCGGCGFAGCDGYAAAVAAGTAPANACTAGGQAVATKLGQILGMEVTAEKKVAFLACNGTKKCAAEKAAYEGVQTCKAVQLTANGSKLCAFGCIGLGDCAHACSFGGIFMGDDGLPHVNYNICTGCGSCVKACPKHLFALIKADTKGSIAVCSNHSDNKPQIRKDCSVGCFKCGLCAKKCPEQCIDVSSGIPKVDYSKCTSCGECIKACPDKVLHLAQDIIK